MATALNKPDKERLGYIDFIKAIAALMIVIYHFSEAHFFQFEFITDGEYIPSIGKCLLGICSAGVPLFFMVNGFLTSKKDYGFKRTLIKILNILKVYFFWGTVIYILISPDNFSVTLIEKALKNNLWIFWFFKTLAFLYLFNYLMHRLSNNCERIARAVIFTCLLLFPFSSNLFWVIVKFLSRDIVVPAWGHTGFFTLYSIVYYLLPTILLKKFEISYLYSFVLILTGIILNFFEVYVYSNAYLHLIDNVNGLFPTIGALLISIGFWYLVRKIHTDESAVFVKFANWIGSNALGVYIFHIPLIYACKYCISRPINPVLGIILCVAITIAASFINTLINKIPYIKWLVKI